MELTLDVITEHVGTIWTGRPPNSNRQPSTPTCWTNGFHRDDGLGHLRDEDGRCMHRMIVTFSSVELRYDITSEDVDRFGRPLDPFVCDCTRAGWYGSGRLPLDAAEDRATGRV